MEWIFVKKGSAFLQIDASSACLREGDFAFVNAKQLHGASEREEDTELVAIVFNEALLRNSGLDSTDERYFSPLLDQRRQIPNFLNTDDPLTGTIGESIARIVDEFETKAPGYELLIKAELFRVFGLLFRHDERLALRPRGTRRREGDFSVLLDYVRHSSRTAPSIREAARMVNMSPNHFCALFKKLTGMTWITYVNLLKVNEAERLLTETDDAIAVIADKVGLGSIGYFGRVFRKYKNRSPSSYRRG